MAVDASLTLEHLFAARSSNNRWLHGIVRRLQRHQEHSDRVQNLVGISQSNATLFVGQDLVRSEFHSIGAGDEGCVAADVFRPTETMRGGCIQIAVVFEKPQVGYFRAEIR